MLLTRQHVAALLALVVLATIAYWPVFSAGFVYDDHLFVENVEAYRNFDVQKMLFGLANGLEYLPIRDLSIALDTALWGDNPLGYHVSNFLLFVVLLVLLYRVILVTTARMDARIPVWTAFVTTLVFALHPLNTEVVAFIAARNNILALIFVVLSTSFFLAAVSGSVKAGLLCILTFGLAMLSKASAVFFPMALIVTYAALVPVRSQSRPVWLLLAALFLLSIAGAAFHAYVAATTGITTPDVARYGADDVAGSLARAAIVPIFYLRYFLFPWPQSISHDETALIAWANVGLAAVLYAGYFTMCLLAFRHRQRFPLVFAGSIWFFAAMLPVSNLIPTNPFVAERYLFPGMVGLALVAASTLEQISWQRLQWLVLTLVASVLLISTHVRSQAWQTDISLWEAAWRVTPRTSAHAYVNALLDDGQVDRALELTDAEKPRTYRYSLVRCTVLSSNSRHAEALPFCKEALVLSSGYSGPVRQQVSLALGRAHEGVGDTYEAMHHYLQIIKDNSATSRLIFLQRAEAAISRLRDSLLPVERELRDSAENRPFEVAAQAEYGLFLLRTGRYDEAVHYFDKARALEPENWRISYNLGLAAAQSGNLETARVAFDEVPRSDPVYAEGLNQVARLYSRLGESASALEYWQLAVAAQPADPTYRYNLARQYVRSGSRSRARQVLEAGMAIRDDADRAFYEQVIENLGL